ncbi:putative ABC transporter ATP-binding protein [Candidatus Magnetomoraceae bacterium gMMP-13]
MESKKFSFEFNTLSINFNKTANDQPDLQHSGSIIKIVPGDKILVLGESGSGKTVFLKCIAGLLEDYHVDLKGSFTFLGNTKEVNNYKDYKKHIRGLFGNYAGMLHQDAINRLHPYRSISKQIEECFFRNNGNKKEKIIDVCRDVDLIRLINPVLDQYDIKKVYKILDSTKRSGLSGGMCQRLGIAMILSQNPSLIFADEPLSDLDVSSRKTLRNMLYSKILSDKNNTVLFATHDTDVIKDNKEFNKIFFVENKIINERAKSIPEIWRKTVINPINIELDDHADTILYSKESIKYKYPGTNDYAVNMEPQDFKFNVKKGEHLGIVGETGSGKSTLARIISYLIRRGTPDIFINTSDGHGESLRKLKTNPYQNIQVVFQDTMGSIDKKETIKESIKRLLKNRGFNDYYKIEDKIKQYFKVIGLSYDEIENQYPYQLSMGMLRRYSLVRASLGLQSKPETGLPKIMILDELTRGLDPINRKKVFNYLQKITQLIRQITYVIISHDIEFVKNICSRILIMYQGWVVEEQYISKNNLEDRFKESGWCHPYSNKLWNKMEIEPQSSENPEKSACKFFKYCKKRDNKCKDLNNISKIYNSDGWYFCKK